MLEVSGYEEFLEALADPSHEEHEAMKEWVGRPLNPTVFSVLEANQRLRKWLRLVKT
jgi:Plasmid pRiA4b ORF-3-like protein